MEIDVEAVPKAKDEESEMTDSKMELKSDEVGKKVEDNSGTDTSEESKTTVVVDSNKKPPQPRTSAAVAKIKEEEEVSEVMLDSPSHISDHCYARPRAEEPTTATTSKKKAAVASEQFVNDHGGYAAARPVTPPPKKVPTPRAKAKATTRLTQAVPSRPSKTYKPRTYKEQFEVLYRFLTKGLDLEDIGYLKRSYEMMLDQTQQEKKLYFLNETHWVDHTVSRNLCTCLN